MVGTALQVHPADIDAMGAFQQGVQGAQRAQANAQQIDANKQQMMEHNLQLLASGAMYAKGNNPNGQVDPHKFGEVVNGLRQMGVQLPDGVENNPQLADVALNASMTTLQRLQMAKTQQDIDQAAQEFDMKMKAGFAPRGGLTPIYGTDANGKTVAMQPTEAGEMRPFSMPEGVNLASGVDKIDQGTFYSLVDKRTGQVVGTLPKDVAGEAAAKASGEAVGKATNPVAKVKAQTSLMALDQQQSLVGQDIDRALSAIQSNPWFTTGGGAALTGWVQGSPGYAVARLLDTIKGNVGFDKLQQMRDNSPTGGALGQVSDFENRMLQSVMGSLDQSNNVQDLVANLKRLKDTMAQMQGLRQQAFAADFAGGGTAKDSPPGTDMTTPAKVGAPTQSKTLDGKTYVQDENGDWYEQ